jgi:hypothetical protein
MSHSETDNAIALTIPDEKVKVPAGHPTLTPETMAGFESIAEGYRETLRKTKRDAVLPGDANPFAYTKYAFDKNGNLAVGRPKGRRINPHRSALTLLLSHATNKAVEAAFKLAEQKAKAEEREVKPDELIAVLNDAMRSAKNQLKRVRKANRKKRRDQSKLSRRINRGLAKGRKFNRSTR